MSLIKCPECGKEISDKAASCPNCGAPVILQNESQNERQPFQDLSEHYGKTGGKQKTQICKHCKSEIPKGAKICPYCKKKQGGILKWIVIALIVIFLIGSIAGGDSKSGKSNEVTSNNIEAQTEQTKDTPSSPDERETEKTIKNKSEFSVGETAEYKDVQITVTGYEESTGNDWGSPEEGMVFVFPEIEIINNSDEEVSISSMLSFECYVDDYKTDFSSNAFMAISTDSGKQQLDGSIAPGKKLKGVLGIEAPQDWATIEIYYKDNVWSGSNFSFKISK